MIGKTAAVYLLQPKHAVELQVLAADLAIAQWTRLPHPYPENGAVEFIEQQLKQRAAGTDFVFAIEDRNRLVGVCGLHGIAGAEARELGYWVGKPFWGQGYASFAAKLTLEFAFRNLQLEKVHAHALQTNAASRRVLEKSGFQLVEVVPHNEPNPNRSDELIAKYEITKSDWNEQLNAPALSKLQAGLKIILEAELAAGNEIRDSGTGWPDPESVMVRLKFPFRSSFAQLPLGVGYAEINDPHWWTAEYYSRFPRHTLAY